MIFFFGNENLFLGMKIQQICQNKQLRWLTTKKKLAQMSFQIKYSIRV